MIKILKYSPVFVLISVTLLILSILSIIFYGFKLSIEYTGGSSISFTKYDSEENVRKQIENLDIEVIESRNIGSVLTFKLNESSNFKLGELQKKLSESDKFEIKDLEIISPAYGLEFAKNSFVGVFLALLIIVLFMAYSFYKVSGSFSPFSFGISALVAMVHDIIIVAGLFSVLGKVFNVEVDALFLTALLTVIGFSINDTIVVFDRIRENLEKYNGKKSVYEISDISIFETLNRSLTTSFTVVIIMFSLFILGTSSIKYFSLALVVGLVAGTYSSIFIATPTLLFLNKFFKK
jgi:preprotein translocase subunit SecF